MLVLDVFHHVGQFPSWSSQMYASFHRCVSFSLGGFLLLSLLLCFFLDSVLLHMVISLHASFLDPFCVLVVLSFYTFFCVVFVSFVHQFRLVFLSCSSFCSRTFDSWTSIFIEHVKEFHTRARISVLEFFLYVSCWSLFDLSFAGFSFFACCCCCCFSCCACPSSFDSLTPFGKRGRPMRGLESQDFVA